MTNSLLVWIAVFLGVALSGCMLGYAGDQDEFYSQVCDGSTIVTTEGDIVRRYECEFECVTPDDGSGAGVFCAPSATADCVGYSMCEGNTLVTCDRRGYPAKDGRRYRATEEGCEVACLGYSDLRAECTSRSKISECETVEAVPSRTASRSRRACLGNSVITCFDGYEVEGAGERPCGASFCIDSTRSEAVPADVDAFCVEDATPVPECDPEAWTQAFDCEGEGSFWCSYGFKTYSDCERPPAFDDDAGNSDGEMDGGL